MIRLAFADTDADIVSAEVLTRNVASLRVLEKLGFEQTGSSLAPFPARGGMLPVVRLERSRHAVIAAPVAAAMSTDAADSVDFLPMAAE